MQRSTFPHQNSPLSITERQRFQSSGLTVFHSGDLEDSERQPVCELAVLQAATHFAVKREAVLIRSNYAKAAPSPSKPRMFATVCPWETSLGGWRCVSSVIESFLLIAPVSFPLSFAPRVPQTHQPRHLSLVQHLGRNEKTQKVQQNSTAQFNHCRDGQILHLFHSCDGVSVAFHQSISEDGVV